MKKILNRLSSYCHEPIQIYLATTWLLCGLFMLLFNAPVANEGLPLELNSLSFSIQGLILIFVSLIGFYGVIKESPKADFIFGAFSVFKSTVLTLQLLSMGMQNPEWIQFVVRMGASILLFHKAIYNLRLFEVNNLLKSEYNNLQYFREPISK